MVTHINDTSILTANTYRQVTQTIITQPLLDVTYTAAQLIGGVITRDAGLTNKTDTFPTATDIITAVKNDNGEATIGTSFRVFVFNPSVTSRINIQGNTGTTINGLARVRPTRTLQLAVVIVDDTVGNETVDVYSLTQSDIA